MIKAEILTHTREQMQSLYNDCSPLIFNETDASTDWINLLFDDERCVTNLSNDNDIVGYVNGVAVNMYIKSGTNHIICRSVDNFEHEETLPTIMRNALTLADVYEDIVVGIEIKSHNRCVLCFYTKNNKED